MNIPPRFLFPILLLGTLLSSTGVWAGKPDKSVEKTIKTVLTSVRYGKDSIAVKKIDFDKMAELSMGESWKDVSPADRKKLSSGIQTITEKLSFPKGRDLFKHLDAILYDAPRVTKDNAHLKTTIVVHRNYKKQEMVIDFILYRGPNGWKIVDTVILGESTLEGFYEDQIEPLLDKGGIPAVMAALDARLNKLK